MIHPIQILLILKNTETIIIIAAFAKTASFAKQRANKFAAVALNANQIANLQYQLPKANKIFSHLILQILK